MNWAEERAEKDDPVLTEFEPRVIAALERIANALEHNSACAEEIRKVQQDILAVNREAQDMNKVWIERSQKNQIAGEKLDLLRELLR